MQTRTFLGVLLAGTVALVGVAALVRVVRRRASERRELDASVTEASIESFPASDPPSFTPVSGPRL